jgi:hypothetical protein
LEIFPGITTLFFKLVEDGNLIGLQTITKKAFHMLISKRTTKHCGTICHSKISSLSELFLFLVQMSKSFEKKSTNSSRIAKAIRTEEYPIH